MKIITIFTIVYQRKTRAGEAKINIIQQRQAKMPAAGATQALRLCLTVVSHKFYSKERTRAGKIKMENAMILFQPIENLWNKYFEIKKISLRKELKCVLSEIISIIELLDNDIRNKYLITLMERYYEEEIQYPIQEPHLWKYCLAIFKDKFEKRETKFFIWMYKSYLYEGVYEIINMQPSDLLLLALKNDLHDNKIASLLYIDYLNTIDFGMHELPECLVIDEPVLIDLINKSLILENEYPNVKGLKNRFGNNLIFYIEILKKWKSGVDHINRITNIYPFRK